MAANGCGDFQTIKNFFQENKGHACNTLLLELVCKNCRNRAHCDFWEPAS